jgi:hypothetical protein
VVQQLEAQADRVSTGDRMPGLTHYGWFSPENKRTSGHSALESRCNRDVPDA